MELRHFRIFITVCDTGSTVEAAKVLSIAQPTVSLAIKELEQQYHIQLFDRISRHLILTDAGKHFLAAANQILEDMDKLETQMQGYENMKELKIGASMTIASTMLPNILLNFKKQYPSTHLVVKIKDSNSLADMVQSLKLDLALIENTVFNSCLETQLFCKDKLIFCCAKGNPLCQRKKISLHDICRQHLLLREQGSASRTLIDSLFKAKGYEMKVDIESTDFVSLLPLVRNNLGISIVPQALVEHDNRLQILHVEGADFQRAYAIIRHKDKTLGTLAHSFINLCMEEGKQGLF
ncbi:MAG: LysR family transcriptional regulator [Spirochaetia bacterium]|jgi:DNA-binding transcriptional LysR family regulator|nr:LysR family transcriptional regulator [Spirochaetia bacterium]